MTRAPDLIVIGGSAGALDALLVVLPRLPDSLTTPIAVVLHLPAAHESLVPRLIAKASRRNVQEAEDKQRLVANTIYVAPPNYHMLVERNGTVALSVDEPVCFSRPSIDVLFQAAAIAYGASVTGVVLSGANQDGAAGLAAIHAAGGVAIVQAPETAAYPLMPASALQRVGSDARAVPLDQLAEFLARTAS